MIAEPVAERAVSSASRGLKYLGYAVAAVVLVVGFWIRSANYHVGYGHPDEPITVEVVNHMRASGDWDTNWAKAPKLEAGLRYDQYNFSSHLYATFAFYRLVKILPGTATWRDEDGGFWVYRFFSVILASIAVWQALRLGWKTGGGRVALVAAALVAVAPVLVQDAHFSRPEAFVTALTLAAVALCWPREKLNGAAVLGGAFVIGVLVACKISMLMIGWLPLVAVLAAGGGLNRWRARLWGIVAGIAIAVVAGFVAGVPGVLAHSDVFMHGVQYLMKQYAGLHPPHSHINGAAVADMLLAYFAATLGWPTLIAGVLGMVVLAVRRRWLVLVVLAGPVVAFGGYFATRGVFFERNLSHIVPLFLVLAAVGVVAVAEWVVARVRGGAGMAVIGVAAATALLVVTPLRVALPLVRDAFGNVIPAEREAMDRAMQAQFPNAVSLQNLLVNDGPLNDLAALLKAGKGPVLFRVTDYNDEWTAYHLRVLAERFEAKPVGEFRGIFADQPTSTLLTYHSPRERYFLVSKPRSP